MAMTIEQQRAINLSRARQRRAAAEGGGDNPETAKTPDMTPLDYVRLAKERHARGERSTAEISPEAAAPIDTTPTRSKTASFLHGAADTAGLGFGDELSAGVGSLLSSKKYDQVLAEMRAMQEDAAKDNPGSYLTGQVGGGIAQAALGGAGIAGSKLAANAGLGAISKASMLDNALLSGIYGAGSGEDATERATGALSGAAIGGAVGGAAPWLTQKVVNAGRRVVSPFTASPQIADEVKTLADEGIRVSAGQKTDNKALKALETQLGGKSFDNFAEGQAEDLTAATMSRIGSPSRNAKQEPVNAAFERIGSVFDDVTKRNELIGDGDMGLDINEAVKNYGLLVPESQRAPIVQSTVSDLADALQRNNGRLPGESYQAMNSRLKTAARQTTDPYLKDAISGITEALDSAFERSLQQTNPQDIVPFREARNQWRNLMVVEQAATAAGSNSAKGFISPQALRAATVQKQGRRAHGRGKGDFSKLAAAAESVLPPLKDSGTALNTWARNAGVTPVTAIGAGIGATQGESVPGGTVGGALGGYLSPMAMGAALMSKPGQKYLGNQLLGGSLSPKISGLLGRFLSGGSRASHDNFGSVTVDDPGTELDGKRGTIIEEGENMVKIRMPDGSIRQVGKKLLKGN